MKRLLRSKSDFRQTILANQLTSLVLFESILTTSPKAKALSAFADHFFHRVRNADLNAYKLAHQLLLDKNAVKKVFEDVLKRYKENETNFVRVIRSTPRRGDNADQSLVILIRPLKIEEPKKEAKTPAVKAPAKKVTKDARKTDSNS